MDIGRAYVEELPEGDIEWNKGKKETKLRSVEEKIKIEEVATYRWKAATNESNNESKVATTWMNKKAARRQQQNAYENEMKKVATSTSVEEKNKMKNGHE